MRSSELAVAPNSSSPRMKMEGELSELGRAAIWYTQQGFPVFPLHSVQEGRCSCGNRQCSSPGKHPRTKRGLNDATTDETAIRAWWSQLPNANIGLPTGEPSGFFAVDIDPRNGGDESIERLLAKHGRYPETAEQITGRGGRHILFRYSPQIITRFPKTLAPGIDLKGPGGYVVVAPSRTQGPYSWDGMDSYDSLKHIADPPDWLVDELNTHERRKPQVVTPNGRSIPQGQRNNELASIAGGLRNMHMDASEIYAALTTINRKRCKPPLPEDEVLQIADSIARYEPATPRPPKKPEASCARPVDIDSIPSVHSISSAGIEFAVEGLIAMSAITMFSGESGGGKSSLLTAVGAHAACGAPFLGRECVARKVLILDRENTLPIVEERLCRLGIQDGGSLKIWGSWLPEEAPAPGASVILEWVEQCNPKPLIIVDSLRAFLDGDENDASVVRPFMHQMRRLADAGAGVIVLHHTGKGETTRDYRGSSDLKASIDIGLNLVNMGDGKLDRLRLRPFKTRFTVDADMILHYADGIFSSDSRTNAVGRTVTERLGELLQERPGIGATEFESLAGSRGLGRDRARQFLHDGIVTGKVRQEPGPKNAKFHYLAKDALAS